MSSERFEFREFRVAPSAASRMEDWPLRLAVTGTWRNAGEYEDRKEVWDGVRKKVLERDGYVCRYCGWGKPPFHVHHADGDPRNDDLSNLVAVCPLCHACRHIGRAVIVGLGGVVEIEGTKSPCLQNEFNFVLQAAWDAGCEPTPVELGRAMRNTFGITGLRAVGSNEALRAANDAVRYGGVVELPENWLFVPAGKPRNEG